MMAKFVNLLGRDINLYSVSGELVAELPFEKAKWGQVVQELGRSVLAKQKIDAIDGISCSRYVSNEPDNFPNTKEGTVYIVPEQAFRNMNRKDLATINTQCAVSIMGVEDPSGFFGLIMNV
jgi:hypothetical protein